MKCVRQLIINITDICNMECKFCLRGDFSGRKLDLSLIPRIFDGIDSIDCITITGGEPSCYVEAVTAIVEYLINSEISVGGFYIVTNAKEYKQELVDAVKQMMFRYIESDYDDLKTTDYSTKHIDADLEELSYSFGVAVSIDQFHEPVPLVNYLKYRTSGVYSASKEYSYSKDAVIARGRGENIPGARERTYYEFSVEADGNIITADDVYITVDGKVFGDCDMSYEMEEEYDAAGDIYEETLAKIMQRYADEEE